MLNAVVRAANTHTGPAMHTHTSTSRPLWVKRSRGGDLILVSCSFWLCAAHLNHWPKNHSWSTFFFFFFATSMSFGRCAAIHRSHSAKRSVCDEGNGRGGEWKSRDGLRWGDRMDGPCGRGEGCLFSEATERHLIFLSRHLHQGDLQRGREGKRERGRERDRALRWL